MPFGSGGGGGYRAVNRYRGRRFNRRRAQRFKRVSRRMVAGAMETKYHPGIVAGAAPAGGLYACGMNTTGNLCEDDSTGNVGAAYFCPFIFENNAGVKTGLLNGDSRISHCNGNKIWLKSCRLNIAFENANNAALCVRVCCFQYHDWADCAPDSTGDTYFNKANVPWGATFGAASAGTKGQIFGLAPSLLAAGKFTILYDTFFVLKATGTYPDAYRFLNIKLNRGFKRLIEFDTGSTGTGTGFHIIRNPLICCIYANVDNDPGIATAVNAQIESRIAYKDI